MSLVLDELAIQVIRKPIKHLYLRVLSDGQVVITAPHRMAKTTIQSFVASKRDWIMARRAQMIQPSIVPSSAIEKNTLQHDRDLLLLGTPYRVKIETQAHFPSIHIDQSMLYFFVPDRFSEARQKIFLDTWLKNHMHIHLRGLIKNWEAMMQVHVASYTLRRMKSRWGSCQPLKRHICMNLQLIHKPLVCMEYVLVHEMVHFFEIRHNQRFYAFMDQYLPQWRCIKKMLDADVSQI